MVKKDNIQAYYSYVKKEPKDIIFISFMACVPDSSRVVPSSGGHNSKTKESIYNRT